VDASRLRCPSDRFLWRGPNLAHNWGFFALEKQFAAPSPPTGVRPGAGEALLAFRPAQGPDTRASAPPHFHSGRGSTAIFRVPVYEGRRCVAATGQRSSLADAGEQPKADDNAKQKGGADDSKPGGTAGSRNIGPERRGAKRDRVSSGTAGQTSSGGKGRAEPGKQARGGSGGHTTREAACKVRQRQQVRQAAPNAG